MTTEAWVSFEEAAEIARTQHHTSVGFAQALVRRAKASGEVRTSEPTNDQLKLQPNIWRLVLEDKFKPGHDIEFAKVIEHARPINRADFLDWLGRQALQLSKPTPKVRETARRTRALEAIKALFPQGIPEQAAAPNKAFCGRVKDWIKINYPTEPLMSDDTILRAANRKSTTRQGN